MMTVKRTPVEKPRPPAGQRGWGRFFSDHMFLAEWNGGQGWSGAHIVPYGPLSLDPAAAVLHYGQAVFEGLKAYRGTDGVVRIFRLHDHVMRLARSADRLCMPPPDRHLAAEGIRTLVRTDSGWVPDEPGSALYLRPAIVATEPFLGVRPAMNYLFLVIASPVDSYYGGGMRPVRIWIETEDVRACAGGLGEAKTGANYAASLRAAEKAKERGFDQVLWLDSRERKYLEEVGTMNLFLDLGREVITPPLQGSILGGVTRDSVLQLLKADGIPVTERPVSLDELAGAHSSGRLKEVWGTGTGAVISPVGEFSCEGKQMKIGSGNIGPLATRLYHQLTAIHHGEMPDRFGWMSEV